MKTNIVIHVMVVFWGMSSCTHQEIPNTGDEIKSEFQSIKLNEVAPTKAFPWNKLIDSLTIIKLETSAVCQIANIDKIVVNNHIYIYDQKPKKLYIFSISGQFIKEIAIGKGPTELTEIRDFLIDASGDLHVLSWKKINIYNSEGTFKVSRKFNFEDGFKLKIAPLHFALSWDNSYYFWSGSFGIKDIGNQNNFAMYKTNNSLHNIEKYYFRMKRELIENTNRLSMFDNEYYITPLLGSDEIYCINPANDKVFLKYKIVFKERALSDKMDNYGDHSESKINYMASTETSLCGFIRNTISSENYFYFVYRCSGFPYQVLFSKRNKDILQGKGFEETSLIQYINIKGAYQNKFVFDYPAYYIEEAFDKIRTCKNKYSNRQLHLKILKELSDVKSSDNHIICIATIKNFV